MKVNDKKTGMSRATIMTVAMLAGAHSARAVDLPKPDAILFGRVTINGQEASRVQRDVIVIARRVNSTTPVASYRMGALPNAGNHFVLRIPLSVKADGVTPNPGRAASGELLELYCSTASAREVLVGTATVPDSGDAIQVDLPTREFSLQPLPVDSGFPGFGSVGCGAGAGGCGAVGLTSMWMMFLGLMRLKRRSFIHKNPRSR